jgi:hypothetical protein
MDGISQWKREANMRLEQMGEGLTNYTPYYNTHSSEFPLLASYNNRYSKTELIPSSNTHSMEYGGGYGDGYNVHAKSYGRRKARRANTRECQLALTYNDNIGVDGVNHKLYNTHSLGVDEGMDPESREEMLEQFNAPKFVDGDAERQNRVHQARTGAGPIGPAWDFVEREYDRPSWQQKVDGDKDRARLDAGGPRGHELLYNNDFVNRGTPNHLMKQGNMRSAYINDDKE